MTTVPDSRPYRRNVAMIVVDQRGRVLVGERANLTGVWQLPQGGVDDGEDEETAMWRELREEIGTADARLLARSNEVYRYDFPDWLKHAPIAQSYRGQEQRYFVVRLNPGVEPQLDRADEEFTAFNWITPSELLDQIVPFKREVYRRAFAELASWLRPDDD